MFNECWYVSVFLVLRSSLTVLVQPTVKFYSSDGHYHVTVLQGEQTTLPLRLTGEGVSQAVNYNLNHAILIHPDSLGLSVIDMATRHSHEDSPLSMTI